MRPIMTMKKYHVMLASFLIGFYVMAVAADSHGGTPAFDASMCLVLDSDFVQCACTSYESTIEELVHIIGKIGVSLDLYEIINETLKYEANLTDTIGRGVCRNLTGFQSCLDVTMMNSTKITDRVISSIVNVGQVAQVLNNTFCRMTEDLKREIPGCLGDVITGSASCVGLHGLAEAATGFSPQPTDTAVTYRDAWCPSLKETTKCITMQTFGCSQNIHQGVADMASGLMTTACQQTPVVSDSENIIESALVRCSMPIIVHVGLTMDPGHIPSLISTIVEGACSRLSHMMNCVDHYMPTSVNLLDKFVNNIVDMGNVKANLQAFSDGYCTSTAQAGVQTIVQCMMNLNNSEAVMNQCITADINATFASMENATALLALSGNDIRTTYCSPMKAFVGCILDTVETHCNDSTVQTMIGTSRDMLLAVLRTDCGGIRQEANVVGDNSATGLCGQTFLFLLLSLPCILFKY